MFFKKERISPENLSNILQQFITEINLESSIDQLSEIIKNPQISERIRRAYLHLIYGAVQNDFDKTQFPLNQFIDFLQNYFYMGKFESRMEFKQFLYDDFEEFRSCLRTSGVGVNMFNEGIPKFIFDGTDREHDFIARGMTTKSIMLDFNKVSKEFQRVSKKYKID